MDQSDIDKYNDAVTKEPKVPGKYFINPTPNIVTISFPIFLFIFID